MQVDNDVIMTSFQFHCTGGVSLSKSGLVPVGRSLPAKKPSETIDPSEVNLHLLPTNQNATDTYSVHCSSRPEKGG